MQDNFYHSPWEPERRPQTVPAQDPWSGPPPLPREGRAPVYRRRGLALLAGFIVLILASIIALAVLQSGTLREDPLQRVFDAVGGQFGSEAGEDRDDGFFFRAPFPREEDTSGRETTIPRAPVAPGVSLAFSPEMGEALAYGDIYDKVIPSIVSIDSMAGGAYYQGTGVIMSSDGYIITNHHVIAGCSRAEVTLYGGQRYPAQLVGSDVESDLAVLKIDAVGLTAAEFGNSDLLRVGDAALAIGNPLGDELFGTMTDGIISAINRDVNVEGYDMTLIQTTAALNPGNSGGALVNTAGQVVGITNMKMMSEWETIEGLGFAIPSVWVKEVVDTLLEKGAITGRPTIGITCAALTPAQAETCGVEAGVYVNSITARGPADKAGLEPGDVILSANGMDTPDLDALTVARDEAGVGGEFWLTVWRNGETLELTLILVDQYELN